MSNGTNLGKAWVQIVPSAQGISGSIQKALNGEATAAGASAGTSFGNSMAGAIKGVISAAGIGLTAATAGVVAFSKSAVDAGKQFDSSMSQVAATMGKTVDEIGDLRDFAMDMGAKTAFSATQAADALNYMALAGYSAETSMQMLPNVLNLAAAGTMDLASASDMITDSQSALGLTLDQTSVLVDQMASASSHANASVSQMGAAILTVGGTAKVLGGGMMTLSDGTKQAYSSTTELNQVLGILADNGVKGAEGGTALRNIILSLTAPTDKAAARLKNLGVKVLDSSGNMRAMKDIFSDMNRAMSEMSEGQKTEVLNEIFNKVDLKSVNALMGTNVQRWDELAEAIEHSKYAAEKMADVQLDNLAGDITLWGSALEGAQIMASDLLTPYLREFVQLGTSGLSAVTDAFKQSNEALNLAEGFRDAEGALRPLGDIAQELTARFGETAAVASTISFRDAEGSLKDVSAFADELSAKLSAMSYDEQLNVASFLGLNGDHAVDDLWEILDPVNKLQWKLEKMIQSGDAAASGDMNVLENLFPGHDREEILSWFDGSEAGAAALQSALEEVDPSVMTDGFSAAMQQLPALISDAVTMILEGLPTVIETGGQILGAVVEGIINALPALADGVAQIIVSLGEYLMDAMPSITEKAGELLKFFAGGILSNIDFIADAALNVIDSFGGFIADAIPRLAETAADMMRSLALTLSDPGVLSKLTQSALALMLPDPGVLSKLTQFALEVIENFIAYLDASLPTVLDAGINFLNEFAQGFMSGLPDFIARVPEIIRSFMGTVTDNLPIVLSGGVTIIESLTEGILSAVPSMTDALFEIIASFVDFMSDNFPVILDKAVELAGILVNAVILALDEIGNKLAEKIPALSIVFENLETIVMTVAAAFGAYAAAMAITGLIDGVSKAITGAQAAFAALNAVMAANPFVLVATVIAGVVAALITLWNTNEDFRNAVQEIWGAITKFFSDAWDAITEVWNQAAGYFGRVWEDIQTVFSVVGKVLGAFFSGAWETVKGIWEFAEPFFKSTWAGIEMIFAVVADVLGGFFSAAWDAIVLVWDVSIGFFENIWNTIAGIFTGVREFFKGNFEGAWKAVTDVFRGWNDFFGQLFDDVVNIFADIGKTFFNIGKDIVNGLKKGISELWGGFLSFLGVKVAKAKDVFTGPEGFDEHSPSKWAQRVGEYVSIGLANGVEATASEAEQAAEKMAANVYNGLSKWADKTVKYERLSLQEQLELWREIQTQFAEGSEQWANAYDKIWDLEEKIADEQTKATEQAVKDSYSALTKWLDKAVKYTDASSVEQMLTWRQALDAFASDSQQYADIEEKLFDLRLSAYQDYANGVEKISGNIDDLQSSYDKAVQERTKAVANSFKLFDAIPEKQEVSGKQLLENLQGQIQRVRSFYDNLAKLQERGMSAAVVEEIRAMGVGASDQLDALLSLSDKKLIEYAELYDEKQSLANSIALSELGELGDETASKIQAQLDDLQALYDENAPALGESFAESLAQGIRNGLSGVTEAAVEVAQTALLKTREMLGMDAAPVSYDVRLDYQTAAGNYSSFDSYYANAPQLSAAGATDGTMETVLVEQPIQITLKERVLGDAVLKYIRTQRRAEGR